MSWSRKGRAANPKNPHEFVLDSRTAREFGYHLGETVTIGWISNRDRCLAGCIAELQGSAATNRIRMKLVGIGATDVDSLFQDQDNANSDQIELFTPAFTRRLLTCCSNDMESGITLDGGTRYLSTVESEIRGILPRGLPFTYVQGPTSREGRNAPSDQNRSPWPCSAGSPAWLRFSSPARSSGGGSGSSMDDLDVLRGARSRSRP